MGLGWGLGSNSDWGWGWGYRVTRLRGCGVTGSGLRGYGITGLRGYGLRGYGVGAPRQRVVEALALDLLDLTLATGQGEARAAW